MRVHLRIRPPPPQPPHTCHPDDMGGVGGAPHIRHFREKRRGAVNGDSAHFIYLFILFYLIPVFHHVRMTGDLARECHAQTGRA